MRNKSILWIEEILKTLAILRCPFLRKVHLLNQRIVVVGAELLGTTIAYELSKLYKIEFIDRIFLKFNNIGSSFN